MNYDNFFKLLKSKVSDGKAERNSAESEPKNGCICI